MKEKSKYSIKNTLGMFDLIKGVIMILVMLGHTYGLFEEILKYESPKAQVAGLGIPRLAFDLLLTVLLKLSMPVLFIISGYGFRKTPIKKCVKNQFKRVMEPYFITALLSIVVYFFVQYFKFAGGLRSSVTETFRYTLGCALGLPCDTSYFGFTMYTCGPLWFMIALFEGAVVFDLLVTRFDGVKLAIASVVVSCVGWLLGLGITLPWALSQGLISVLFICLGYLAKKNKFFTTEFTVKKTMIVVVVGIMSFLLSLSGDVNMAISTYGLGFISIIALGLFGVIVIYLCLYLNRFNGKMVAAGRWIGRMSLYVICVHSIEKNTFGDFIMYKFIGNWQGSIFARSMIIFGVRLVVVLTATFVFIKLKDYYMNKRIPLLN